MSVGVESGIRPKSFQDSTESHLQLLMNVQLKAFTRAIAMRSAFLTFTCFVGLTFPALGESDALEDFRNRHLSEFEAYAVEQNLTIVRELRSSILPIGVVIEHVPGVGGTAGLDGRIVAYISDGIEVPGGLTGRPVEEVLLRLEEVGLQAQVTYRPSRAPPDMVGATIPREGERIDATVDAVTVVVSTIQIVPIPNVTGLSYEVARRELQADGFMPSGELSSSPLRRNCTLITYFDRIERTDPPADSLVPHGSTVQLIGARKSEAITTGYCR